MFVCDCAHVTEPTASQETWHGVNMCVIESEGLNFTECKSLKIRNATDETSYEP